MYDAEMSWVLFRYAYVLYNDEETAKATVEKYTEHPPVLKFALDVKLYREPAEIPRGAVHIIWMAYGSGNSCIDMNYVAMFLCDCIGGQDYWSLTDHSRGSFGAFDPVCLCARQKKTFEHSDLWPTRCVGRCHPNTPFYSLSTTTSTACCFIN